MTNDLALLTEPAIAMQIGAMGDYAGIKMNLEEKNEPMVDEVELNTHLSVKDKDMRKERFNSFIEQYEKDREPMVQKVDTAEEDVPVRGLMSKEDEVEI